MLVVIDNYDSFTYNLVQYLGELGETLEVFRNDAVTVAKVAALRPEAIVVSPGPCTPREAGISVRLLQELGPAIPTLGVCLGHQCIGEAFGGTVVRAPEIMHGKTSLVFHDGQGVFAGLPVPFEAIRYHSLIVERSSLPDDLVATAQTSLGLIMGLRHRRYPIEGVQFHPESIKTEHGKALLQNFLTMARSTRAATHEAVAV
jgi:anthranilate synthase component 2